MATTPTIPDMVRVGPPAGWYRDPRGLPQLRFWNGAAWTNQVRSARRPALVGSAA